MRIAIIGITGMVGQEMLSVLEERKLPFNELIPVASKKSTSKIISFKNKKIPIINIEELLLNPPKLALFSAGAEISKKWARGPFERAIRFVACVDARERAIDARERSMDETRNGRANDGRLRVARARGADCGRVDGASGAMMR